MRIAKRFDVSDAIVEGTKGFVVMDNVTNERFDAFKLGRNSFEYTVSGFDPSLDDDETGIHDQQLDVTVEAVSAAIENWMGMTGGEEKSEVIFKFAKFVTQ